MELKKLNPWNWFKNEEDEEHELAELDRENSNHSLSRLHHEFDRFLESVLGNSSFFADSLTSGFFHPTLDISESDEGYEIDIEVPGAEKDDVKVECIGGTLIVTGEKRNESRDDNKNYHRVERSYGSFRRTLNLPPDADAEHLEARFKDGVLKIELPKVEQSETAKARPIKIHG